MANTLQDDFEGDFIDNALNDFNTYEDYLDDKITPTDLMYLEDRELARQLKELGYQAKTEILTREMFEKKKLAIAEAKNNQSKDKTRTLASSEIQNKDFIKASPFLKELADKEEEVLNGRLLAIIFIRHETKNTEISGYIDYAHRLKTEDFKPYFEGKKKLLPRPTDLSYYNWKTGLTVSNDSPNFKVDANSGQQGLLFRNKRDRKVINVDPKKKPDDQTTKRVELTTPEYTQVVLYHHYTRRKN